MNIDVFSNMTVIAACFTYTCILCFSATNASQDLYDVGTSVYLSKWYLYPTSMQKYFLPIASQRKVEFSGYNIIYCNMESFLKVIPTVSPE